MIPKDGHRYQRVNIKPKVGLRGLQSSLQFKK